MGCFKKFRSMDEKAERMEVVGQYRQGLVPLIVPIVTNVRAFRRALGIWTTQQISVLLVTPAGEVLGHVSGRYSGETESSINRVLNVGS
jgi:hypothetical protein